jgi:hypothetical protein
LRRWLAWPKIFFDNCRKDGVKGNLQKYRLVPFDASLIYVYGFVARLEFSTVGLYYHMEASGDPSETKSEISCANSLRNLVNFSWTEIDITYQ